MCSVRRRQAARCNYDGSHQHCHSNMPVVAGEVVNVLLSFSPHTLKHTFGTFVSHNQENVIWRLLAKEHTCVSSDCMGCSVHCRGVKSGEKKLYCRVNKS